MSNKKAWSRGMIDAKHADKLPPCFLDVEEAVEARDDPTKREEWHEGGIYLKLATGVEGKVGTSASLHVPLHPCTYLSIPRTDEGTDEWWGRHKKGTMITQLSVHNQRVVTQLSVHNQRHHWAPAPRKIATIKCFHN